MRRFTQIVHVFGNPQFIAESVFWENEGCVSKNHRILLANSNQWYFNGLVKRPCQKTPSRCPHRLNLSSQSSRSCAGPNIKLLKDKDLEVANSIPRFFKTNKPTFFVKGILTGSSTLNRGRVRLQRKRGSRHTSSWHAPQHNQERRIVMDPTTVFCPNLACPARGQTGQGNIGIHSQKEQRFICHACHKTFSATKGTAFYRLRTAAETVALVATLLAHGRTAQVT